ncbi:MAG: DNA repair protein RecN [Rhodobacterales bacterium]|nr:DNA repair protein RecN [Rhodobacterales bacterium]
MLRGLEIRDMLIIERLDLGFQPGLSVLTGETGAGKSILLDSLGFVLGWRGRAELVRAGAEQGEVVAWFDLAEGHPAHAILNEAGLPDGDELILRRINTRDGRKTAWVNDRRVSGEVLRNLSATLVELHGQHDDRGLLNPKGHRAILDEFGGLEALRAKTGKAWRALRAAGKAHVAAIAALEEVRAQEEFLRHAVAELDELSPMAGEDAELDASRRKMQAAEKVREDVIKAHEALGGNGAESIVLNALRWLEDADAVIEGKLGGSIEAIGRVLVALDEAADGVVRCLDDLAFDPNELEVTEERLFAIRALARKHDVLADDLAQFGAGLRVQLAALDQGESDVATLRAALSEAEATYDSAATALSKARAKAAGRLDKAVMGELAPLKMERAVFTTAVEPSDAGPEGRDLVAFHVATNPGAPAGPLAKIASGGELSRFLLALKVCLSADAGGITMIFDEIDRGVGGATADAVGRRLADLARGGQVLVVTHSPQVAAFGATHWRVEKTVRKGMTLSTVVPLEAEERVDEIARMLSGDRVTDEARAAALSLIAAQ